MPRAVQADALAKTILSATASLIEDEGVDALTMRAVATRASYSPTAIYLVFKNKKELLEATVVRMRALLIEELMREEISDDLAVYLNRVGVRFVRWGVQNPNGYRLLFEQRDGQPAFTTVAALQSDVWSGDRDVTERVFANELSRYPDPAGIVDLAWATLHGIVWLAITGQLGPVGANVTERAARLAATFASLALGASESPTTEPDTSG